MSDWLASLHLYWVANYKILWGELIHCSTVDVLRSLAVLLLALFLLRLAIAWLAGRWLVRGAVPVAASGHPQLWAAYRRAMSKTGLKRTIPLLQWFDPGHPAFTMGTLRPVVFLNPGVLERFDGGELEAILVHELVHVRRRDNLRQWLQVGAMPMLPLAVVQLFAAKFVASAWFSLFAVAGTLVLLAAFQWGCRRLWSDRRERRCDEETVRLTGRPLALASALVKAWRTARTGRSAHSWFLPVCGLVAGGSCLERRLIRLTSGSISHPAGRGTLWLKRTGYLLLVLQTAFLFRYHVLDSYRQWSTGTLLAGIGCGHCPEKAAAVCHSPLNIAGREFGVVVSRCDAGR